MTPEAAQGTRWRDAHLDEMAKCPLNGAYITKASCLRRLAKIVASPKRTSNGPSRNAQLILCRKCLRRNRQRILKYGKEALEMDLRANLDQITKEILKKDYTKGWSE